MKTLEELAAHRNALRSELAEVDAEVAAEVRRIQAEESRQMTAAARVLGISKQALYKFIRQH